MKLPAQPDGPPRRLQLVLPAVHAAARSARQVAKTFAKLDGLADADVEQLALVVSELATNAVDHGGGEAAMDVGDLTDDTVFELVLELDRDGWRLEVSDQGGGDPDVLQPFLEDGAEIPLEDERGRGFFLMRHLVDRLTVEKSADGRGLRVLVAKRHGVDEAGVDETGPDESGADANGAGA